MCWSSDSERVYKQMSVNSISLQICWRRKKKVNLRPTGALRLHYPQSVFNSIRIALVSSAEQPAAAVRKIAEICPRPISVQDTNVSLFTRRSNMNVGWSLRKYWQGVKYPRQYSRSDAENMEMICDVTCQLLGPRNWPMDTVFTCEMPTTKDGSKCVASCANGLTGPPKYLSKC